ncbi:MAG: adenosine kinase [Fimbriimonadaceae bacterium]|jgi:hypothetical protein|nr:adenosine kinase [Fimbriimonadaceae bacterium]
MAHFDVFTMCNAIFDLQAEVDDQFLETIGYQKGAMNLVGHAEQEKVVPLIMDTIVNAEPGGSGANTAQGLSILGRKAAFMSCVGRDQHGQLYSEGLEERGVKANLRVSDGTTGLCLVLITPDAQRTMLTYLGTSREVGPADVNLADLQNSRYLYVTAYMWDTDLQKEAVTHAMTQAKRAGVKIALSLSDSFCVNRHKEDLLGLVQDHVDVICGNHLETMALTDTETPEDSLKALKSHCEVAAVTMGARGSILMEDGEVVAIPASPVKPIDTTGAGDFYMSGLLAGITKGLSLLETGQLASDIADIVIAKVSPRVTLEEARAAKLI